MSYTQFMWRGEPVTRQEFKLLEAGKADMVDGRFILLSGEAPEQDPAPELMRSTDRETQNRIIDLA